MDIAEMNAVSRMVRWAHILKTAFGDVATLNTLFNGAPDYDGAITTEMLQGVPAFAHLSQSDLTEFAHLTGIVHEQIVAKMLALSNLTTGE